MSIRGVKEGSQQELMSKSNSMDDIQGIPKWLKLNIDEVFSVDSLNVWIPTDDFETSPSIRAPRFPHKYSSADLKKNESLTNFGSVSIGSVNIANREVLELTFVRNEQTSAQTAFSSKKNLTNVLIAIDDSTSVNGDVLSRDNLQIRCVKYLPVQ